MILGHFHHSSWQKSGGVQPKVLILGDCDHAICAWQTSSLNLLHDNQRGCFNDLTKRRLEQWLQQVTLSWPPSLKIPGGQNLQKNRTLQRFFLSLPKKKTWFWILSILFLKCLSSQRTPYKFTWIQWKQWYLPEVAMAHACGSRWKWLTR